MFEMANSHLIAGGKGKAMAESHEQSEHDESDAPRVLTESELLGIRVNAGLIGPSRDPRPAEQHDKPYSSADLE
jgi:hypothetical protein